MTRKGNSWDDRFRSSTVHLEYIYTYLTHADLLTCCLWPSQLLDVAISRSSISSPEFKHAGQRGRGATSESGESGMRARAGD